MSDGTCFLERPIVISLLTDYLSDADIKTLKYPQQLLSCYATECIAFFPCALTSLLLRAQLRSKNFFFC
jgi:hypothetical protein